MLSLYEHYKNKLLAKSGGVLDQPAGYLDAMQVIESALNEFRASGAS